jgi:RsiW-degrading membrane proteinase PrsW (M82 family)
MRKLLNFLKEQAFWLFLPCLWPLAILSTDASAPPLLPKETWAHYVMAAASASLFLGFIHTLFRDAVPSFWRLARLAVIVGTLGMAMLLGFQWLADWAVAGHISSDSWVFIAIKAIGYSYRAIRHPDLLPLPVVLVGYVISVGLCEEACKATFVDVPASWRAACKQGLACGVGFGVAEGIYYSQDRYNGVAAADLYVVRFVACVTLHALLSGGVAIRLAHRGERLWESKATFFKVLLVPVVIHGLYDTFVTFGMRQPALICAGLSFAWLWMLIVHSRMRERTERARPTLFFSR